MRGKNQHKIGRDASKQRIDEMRSANPKPIVLILC